MTSGRDRRTRPECGTPVRVGANINSFTVRASDGSGQHQMADFRDSEYYGSRVEPARRESGWLSDGDFIRRGREEFRNYRIGAGGNSLPTAKGIFSLILLILAVGALFSIAQGLEAVMNNASNAIYDVDRYLSAFPWKGIAIVIADIWLGVYIWLKLL